MKYWVAGFFPRRPTGGSSRGINQPHPHTSLYSSSATECPRENTEEALSARSMCVIEVPHILQIKCMMLFIPVIPKVRMALNQVEKVRSVRKCDAIRDCAFEGDFSMTLLSHNVFHTLLFTYSVHYSTSVYQIVYIIRYYNFF